MTLWIGKCDACGIQSNGGYRNQPAAHVHETCPKPTSGIVSYTAIETPPRVGVTDETPEPATVSDEDVRTACDAYWKASYPRRDAVAANEYWMRAALEAYAARSKLAPRGLSEDEAKETVELFERMLGLIEADGTIDYHVIKDLRLKVAGVRHFARTIIAAQDAQAGGGETDTKEILPIRDGDDIYWVTGDRRSIDFLEQTLHGMRGGGEDGPSRCIGKCDRCGAEFDCGLRSQPASHFHYKYSTYSCAGVICYTERPATPKPPLGTRDGSGDDILDVEGARRDIAAIMADTDARYAAWESATPKQAEGGPTVGRQPVAQDIEDLSAKLLDAWDDELNPRHGAAWPEHDKDDGYRDGGYIRLQSSDVQARMRAFAKRVYAITHPASDELRRLRVRSYDKRLATIVYQVEDEICIEWDGGGICVVHKNDVEFIDAALREPQS